MGGSFKMKGVYVYLWLIHVEVLQKTTKICKAIILQLKKIAKIFFQNNLLDRIGQHFRQWSAFNKDLGCLTSGGSFHIYSIPDTIVHACMLSCLTLCDPMDCSLYRCHAAAAAKSLQSCPTLCDPIDGSPPGSAIPGILQARTLEWVAISFSNAWKWKVKVKSLSRVRFLATTWTAAFQAPPPMGFSRQEYWSGVPLPSPMRLYRYRNVFLPPWVIQDYK